MYTLVLCFYKYFDSYKYFYLYIFDYFTLNSFLVGYIATASVPPSVNIPQENSRILLFLLSVLG